MLDVDNFKYVKDEFGMILEIKTYSLSKILKENIRTDDIVCRLSGDKF